MPYKKIACKILLLCLLLSPTSLFAASAASQVPGLSMEALDKLFDRVQKTGVSLNAIAAINNPEFLSVSDASLSLDDDAQVFVVHYPTGLTRIYPQSILVWHEVVNDSIPQKATSQYGGDAGLESDGYSITYSPLTGSVVVFKGQAGRYKTRLFSAGTLLNGNQILYDSTTQNQWSQLLDVSLDGSLMGSRLERIPAFWCRWGGAKHRFQDAEVLSRSTGYKRSYGRDPYGSYSSDDSYYTNLLLPAGVWPVSNKLPPKLRILGVEFEGRYAAIIRDAVKDSKVLNLNIGTTQLVAMYDEELERITVFHRELKSGDVLNFEFFEDRLVDTTSRSEWSTDGTCSYGKYRNSSLEPILAIDSMWFAWYAFHPNTQILDKSSISILQVPGPNIP